MWPAVTPELECVGPPRHPKYSFYLVTLGHLVSLTSHGLLGTSKESGGEMYTSLNSLEGGRECRQNEIIWG